jgi:hypothetical protein
VEEINTELSALAARRIIFVAKANFILLIIIPRPEGRGYSIMNFA